MTAWISRRSVMAGALLLPCAAAAEEPFAALEKQSGARIGVAALDTGSGKRIAWRAHERFVMCSTFKLSLAAAILAKVDRGGEQLDRLVHYGADAPIGVSPGTRKNVARGMTIAELCEAAVLYSDNGAANTLLASLGGPAGLTAYWRGLGDRLSRLDDFELKLNIPDGMRTTTTGAGRLHAGLPPAWQWGDKTGTSDTRYGLVNDIGIATPPGRNPILMVAYTERSNEKTVAAVGEILARAFA